jgi:hypothetical protein
MANLSPNDSPRQMMSCSCLLSYLYLFIIVVATMLVSCRNNMICHDKGRSTKCKINIKLRDKEYYTEDEN